MNLSKKQKQNQGHRKLVVAKGMGCGRGLNWEFGISRCKLVQRKQINNKVLLYSTGNYIQYPVINHNGKEYEKEIYICITELLYCIAVINTIFQFKYTSIINSKNYKKKRCCLIWGVTIQWVLCLFCMVNKFQRSTAQQSDYS